MILAVLVVAALLCDLGISAAQSVSPTLRFEVASIKPQTGERQSRRASSPDRFTNPDTTLRELVEYAYELTPLQVVGGPEWMATRRFAVDAKATGTPTRAEMRLLVRALLADRFKLTAHTETRDMPVYLLERARPEGTLGPLLRPTPGSECSAVVVPSGTAREPGAPPPCGAVSASPVRVTARGVTMNQFARNIRDLGGMTGVDRIVIDRTNLPGAYNIDDMSYRPVETSPLAGGDNNSGFFDALREQLGLKLTPSRAAVDVLVVDSATEPTPD